MWFDVSMSFTCRHHITNYPKKKNFLRQLQLEMQMYSKVFKMIAKNMTFGHTQNSFFICIWQSAIFVPESNFKFSFKYLLHKMGTQATLFLTRNRIFSIRFMPIILCGFFFLSLADAVVRGKFTKDLYKYPNGTENKMLKYSGR